MIDVAPWVPGVTLAGEKPHTDPLGSPEHESDTAELNAPPIGFTVTLKFLDCPCLIVAEPGFTPTEKSTPVPFNSIDCGLPEALSETLTVPV